MRPGALPTWRVSTPAARSAARALSPSGPAGSRETIRASWPSEASPAGAAPGTRLYLDLGTVPELARVTIDGREIATA